MSGTAVKLGLAAALAAANLFPAAGATRGLLVHPGEFSAKWIERARMTGVDTLALHPEGGPHSFTSLTNLLSQMRTDGFRALVDRAIDAGLRIEYEFHAGGYLLPRELFAGHPEYFRLDEKGVRNPDFDFCVANPEALAIVAARARQLVDSLYRSTDRYYFWLDDTDAGGCRCPGCAALTPSDRQLKALNAMIREMRKSNPRATLAYLAYRSTLERPRTVKPEDGIFLEYAPIERVWDKPVSAQNIADPARLGELIAYFGGKGAKVLEYWYDNSLFSQWTKPARLFRPANAVVRADLAYYGRIGFADIASFACYLGDDYEAAWGEPDLSAFAPAAASAAGPWASSQWITAGAGQGTARPAMRLTREFTVTGEVAKAVLRATALGLYVPYVNGREITGRRLLPGWTQYERRVVAQEFDVTRHLAAGTNTVSALVGDGWYCGQIAYVATGEPGWGTKARFRAELALEYRDGRRETIGTDGSWTSFYLYPATLANDIYQGEEYDATLDDERWKLPGCRRLDNASGVQTVSEQCEIAGDLGQGVVVDRVLKPVKIERRPSGTIMLDFGENIAGVDRISLKKAHPGAVIVIRHGEDVDREGNLWRVNLAFAGQKTVLTCGSRAPFVYVPRFTFYGYRYAEVSGWPADEEFTSESVQAEVLTSATRRTGEFSSSNPLLDRLYANVLRSQQGNFIDVPTDCPQRCERFGWTGDAQIFAETAMMNYDVEKFFVKWMGDVRLGCNATGAFPMVAPWPGNGDATSRGTGMAGWSDAGVVVPWMLYRKYANRDALAEAYPSMAKYVAALAADSKLATIGDHLNLDQPTSGAFVAEALRIEMLRLAALAADALGNGADAVRWRALRGDCVRAFRAKHCGADGLPRERTQTAMAMAIVYGICADGAGRRAAGAELVALLRERGGHLATGFLGTPILLRALTESGNLDAAYRLLETETSPGWLYPVTQGATTIWERWDAKVDGRYHANWMNSMNHYAYGSVAGWFYDTILGIRDLTEQDVSAPGFAKTLIAPRVGGSLEWAKGAFESRHGRIGCAWRRDGDRIEVEVSVPAGVSAEFDFPGRVIEESPAGAVRTGERRWRVPQGRVCRWTGRL